MPDERSATLAAPERFGANSVAHVADLVRTARVEATPFRIVGGGTWLDAGHTVDAAKSLDLSGLAGIIEYVPGDLVLTAYAGTTLAEISEATAAHGQWLPLDPFGDPRGTLGATLATASAGPLGGSVGLPRDVTVGLSFVSGEGDVVSGGGRVVKNVAGFDLVRLTIGAWGTLGVITQASVRLRARPEVDETFALELPRERDAIATLLSNLRVAAIDPLAAELLTPACADGIGLGSDSMILVRLAGNTFAVQHQRATLARLAQCVPVPDDVWSRLGTTDPVGGGIVRVSRRPSELARLWSTTMAMPGVNAHATFARGVVRIRLASADANALASFDADDRRIFENAPAGWNHAPSTSDGIPRRLRDAFDPARILNRGIMGEDTP